jgi:hypothetical protein
MRKAQVLYRVAAVLLVLFCVGHTLGFRTTDPAWGVEGVVSSMKTVQFTVQGFQRSYWDFYVGFGLFVSVLLLFAALVAWQLGGPEAALMNRLKGIGWALALCFALNCYLSWRYFFVIPLVFSVLITVCLALGAWFAGRAASTLEEHSQERLRH